uniref:Rab-GAP TBC domain-containing protein n=1 Tax=Euplotes harpa TaxID=151035 RepID=A0A7S3N4W6_9SPIT
MPDPYQEQIDLDLKRTFSDDEEFTNDLAQMDKMMSILLSYSKRNTSIGYCQGMNYLAGIVSRVVEDEEEAFWVLVNLFEGILPIDYFCLMTEILVDQKILIQILQKKKVKLFKHLQNIGLDFAIISFQWLVCLLTANLSREISESIWDFLLLEGSVAIFRAILAILNLLENELLMQDDFNDLYQMLENGPLEKVK